MSVENLTQYETFSKRVLNLNSAATSNIKDLGNTAFSIISISNPSQDKAVEFHKVIATDYDADRYLNKYRCGIQIIGKNKLNPYRCENTSLTTFNNKDCLVYIDGSEYFSYSGDFKENTAYTFQATMYREETYMSEACVIKVDYTDGSIDTYNFYNNINNSFTTNSNKTLAKIRGNWNNEHKIYIDIDTLQLEEGATKTEYFAYNERVENIYLDAPLTNATPITFNNNDVYLGSKLIKTTNNIFFIENRSSIHVDSIFKPNIEIIYPEMEIYNRTTENKEFKDEILIVGDNSIKSLDPDFDIEINKVYGKTCENLLTAYKDPAYLKAHEDNEYTASKFVIANHVEPNTYIEELQGSAAGVGLIGDDEKYKTEIITYTTEEDMSGKDKTIATFTDGKAMITSLEGYTSYNQIDLQGPVNSAVSVGSFEGECNLTNVLNGHTIISSIKGNTVLNSVEKGNVEKRLTTGNAAIFEDISTDSEISIDGFLDEVEGRTYQNIVKNGQIINTISSLLPTCIYETLELSPSTQYLIKIDKSEGQLTYNLGGTTLASSNNQISITTPAIITENALILSGNGITVTNAQVFKEKTEIISKNYVDNIESVGIKDKKTYTGDFVTIDKLRYNTQLLEILGDTWQDTANLSNIKSVGTLREDGLYDVNILLSGGKNLFDEKFIEGQISTTGPILTSNDNTKYYNLKFARINDTKMFGVTFNSKIKVLPCFYTKTGNFIRNTGWKETNFTINPNEVVIGELLRFEIRKKDGTIFNEIDLSTTQLMLEEISTYGQYSTYEPYQETKLSITLPSQLNKIGDVQDKIYYDSNKDKLILEKHINKISSLKWSYYMADSTLATATINNAFTNIATDSPVIVKNYLTAEMAWTFPTAGFRQYDNYKAIFLTDTITKIGSSVAVNIETYFNNQNIEIYYVMATPEIIELNSTINLEPSEKSYYLELEKDYNLTNATMKIESTNYNVSINSKLTDNFYLKGTKTAATQPDLQCSAVYSGNNVKITSTGTSSYTVLDFVNVFNENKKYKLTCDIVATDLINSSYKIMLTSNPNAPTEANSLFMTSETRITEDITHIEIDSFSITNRSRLFLFIYAYNNTVLEYKNIEIVEVTENSEAFIPLPQPLRAINNYKDKLYYDRDKGRYCIEQKIYNKSISGYENYAIHSNNRFEITLDDCLSINNQDSINCISSYPVSSYSDCILDEQVVNAICANNNIIGLSNTSYTTVEELKEWLNQNPIELYYVLEEPETIELLTLDHKPLSVYSGLNSIEISNLNIYPSKVKIAEKIARYKFKNTYPSNWLVCNVKGSNTTYEVGDKSGALLETSSDVYSIVTKQLDTITSDDGYIYFRGTGSITDVMLIDCDPANNIDFNYDYYFDDSKSVGELQENGTYNINAISKNKNNLYNGVVVADKSISSTDGSIVSAIDWNYSPHYFRINPGIPIYSFHGSTGSNIVCFCFYDINKKFISRNDFAVTTACKQILITPNNAYYLRIVMHLSIRNSLYIGINFNSTNAKVSTVTFNNPVALTKDQIITLNPVHLSTYLNSTNIKLSGGIKCKTITTSTYLHPVNNLKPSTLYSIQFDCNKAQAESELILKLGGTTLLIPYTEIKTYNNLIITTLPDVVSTNKNYLEIQGYNHVLSNVMIMEGIMPKTTYHKGIRSAFEDYNNIEFEGNDLSLPNKNYDGKIDIDKIVGNTMVNYCADGDRELILNGDIDISGTNVSTTEGVDNGLVDVICEGNTLINLVINTEGNLFGTSGYGRITREFFNNGCKYITTSDTLSHITIRTGSVKLLKPSTDYTIVFEIAKNTIKSGSYKGITISGWSDSYHTGGGDEQIFRDDNFSLAPGIKKIKITTHSSLSNYSGFGFGFPDISTSVAGMEFIIQDVLILEGNWINKKTPLYFNGMKSVGQDNTNGHNISITSWNKNLLSNTSLSTKDNWYFYGDIVDGVNGNKAMYSAYIANSETYHDPLQQTIYNSKNTSNKIESGKWYTFSFYVKGTGFIRTHAYPNIINTSANGFADGKEVTLAGDGYYEWNLTNQWTKHSYTFKAKDNLSGTNNILFRLTPAVNGIENAVYISCPMLEEGKTTTTFCNDIFNTKTISLSAPLRGLPNGVKDRFIKREGKWYVERNCGKVVLNGSEYSIHETTDANTCRFFTPLPNYNVNTNIVIPFINDRFVNVNKYAIDEEGIFSAWGGIYLRLNKTRLNIISLQGYKDYLVQNPTTVVYQLATPTYEPLDLSPELTTYLEQTYITNNSVIPCNMVVRNTGYSALIKPSTLYTVIADKNIEGTLGVNLGGTKLTTSTNKLTITTPATLTENIVRLYGKGLTGSNVRVLEGNCTALNYPYFEGLKSSFEGQLVTQEMVNSGTEKAENLGKYKVTTKVRGKNAYCIDNIISTTNRDSSSISSLIGVFKNNLNNKTVTFSAYKKNKEWNNNDRLWIIGFKEDKWRNYSFVSIRSVNEIEINLGLEGTKDNYKIYNTKDLGNKDINYWYVYSYNSVENSTYYNIQLEEGTVATPYEPYYERTQTVYLTSPLRKGDEIIAKEDGLYHYHKMGKIVLNGTENWVIGYGGTTGEVNKFETVLPNPSDKNHSNFYSTSNKFNWYPNDETTPEWGYRVTYSKKSNAYMMFNIPVKIVPLFNIDAWKKWLQVNPTTVLYELPEPYSEKISDNKLLLPTIRKGNLSIYSDIPVTKTSIKSNISVTTNKNNLFMFTEPLRSIGTYKDRLYVENNKVLIERKVRKLKWSDTNGILTEGHLISLSPTDNNILQIGTGKFFIEYNEVTNKESITKPGDWYGYAFVSYSGGKELNNIENAKQWLNNQNILMLYKTPIIEDTGLRVDSTLMLDYDLNGITKNTTVPSYCGIKLLDNAQQISITLPQKLLDTNTLKWDRKNNKYKIITKAADTLEESSIDTDIVTPYEVSTKVTRLVTQYTNSVVPSKIKLSNLNRVINYDLEIGKDYTIMFDIANPVGNIEINLGGTTLIKPATSKMIFYAEKVTQNNIIVYGSNTSKISNIMLFKRDVIETLNYFEGTESSGYYDGKTYNYEVCVYSNRKLVTDVSNLNNLSNI